ncbi:MAG: phosphotransferase, partial [Phycisphaerae bacterium]
STLGRISVEDPVTLHNDFHWNQLRINDDRIAMLDLERMCLGDPLVDVANFAGQVRMLGVRPEHEIDSATATTWAYAFLEEWSIYTCRHIHPIRFRCYLAVTLLELARGMMRHLRPGWQDLAHRCVEQASGDMGSLAREVAPA